MSATVSATITAVSTAILAGVALAALIVAGRQLNESHKTRTAQTRPYVVVHLAHSHADWHLLNIVIRNIGTTPGPRQSHVSAGQQQCEGSVRVSGVMS